MLKAYFSMKPTEKMFSLLGGKIEYDFHFIKFKINFPAKDMKDFFGGFHRKVSLYKFQHNFFTIEILLSSI